MFFANLVGLRVTARKTIKQRRGKLWPVAAGRPAPAQRCLTTRDAGAGTHLTAYQKINIFTPKKHGTGNILIKTDDGWDRRSLIPPPYISRVSVTMLICWK